MAVFGVSHPLLGVDVAVPHWTPALAALRAAQQEAGAAFADVVLRTIVHEGRVLHREAEVRSGVARDVLTGSPDVSGADFSAWLDEQLNGPAFAEHVAATEAALRAALLANARYVVAVRRAAYPAPASAQ
jgi:hypothetical protein